MWDKIKTTQKGEGRTWPPELKPPCNKPKKKKKRCRNPYHNLYHNLRISCFKHHQCGSHNTKSKSLYPSCQKLTRYQGALKRPERHRKCLLVPPRMQQCASNCLNLKCFIGEQPCVSHRLDVMHLGEVGIGAGSEGGLRTLFSTTFKCSVSQNYPPCKGGQDKAPDDRG